MIKNNSSHLEWWHNKSISTKRDLATKYFTGMRLIKLTDENIKHIYDHELF